MRRVLFVAVVALAALSGCSALESGETTAADDGFSPGADAPDWMDEDGEVNESALLVAHLEAANQSTVAIDQRNGNNSVSVVQGPDAVYARDSGGVTYTRGNLELGNATLSEADYSVRYDQSRAGITSTRAVTFGLSIRLSTAEYEAVGTTTRDGQELYELEMVDTTGMGETIGHYTGTALVEPNGRIHSLRGEVGDNESAADAYSYEFDWTAETVPEPAWRDSVPQVQAGLGPDNESVVLEHTGGAGIPSDTTLELSVSLEESFDGRVELDAPLAPGETLYVGVDDSGEDRQAVAGRSSLPGSLVDLTGSSVLVENGALTVEGRTVDFQVRVGTSVL